jgi:peroxiredoxin Q/BCP
MLNLNDNIGEIKAIDDLGNEINLADFRGNKLVLYFYPKDDTPGCTAEAQDFRDSIIEFKNKDAVVIGVSRDSVSKHQKFKKKYNLDFPLISDEEGELCKKFGVWVEKSMFGKKYFGIDRATFLIDKNGEIVEIWKKVKVKDHVKEVLTKLGNNY